MIEGEINEETKEIKTNFIPLNEAEFEEIEMNISDILSKEELIERLNDEKFLMNNYLKIILTGNKRFEIETSQILKHLLNPNIIKLKDKTKLEVDLEKIAEQNNLKGIFVRTLLEKKEQEPENKEKIEKAIEIGLRFI